MSVNEDVARFGAMSAEQMIERLKAAEDVCVLYGWTGSAAPESERAKALHELWDKWYALVGHDACSPEGNPHLTNEFIAELARKRDATREATLRYFFGDEAVDNQ